MALKGKTFRSSPLCSQEVGDSFSENDEEVEHILSESQCESRKRSPEREDDCVSQNERRETGLGVSSNEPANVVVNSHHFVSGHKRKKIDRSSFKDYDRLLTREEREHLSCKEKSIYNTKKRKITKEVEKRWPPGSALPVYRNKADAIQVDKFVAKLVEDDTHLYTECGLGKEAVLETVLKKIREQRRQQKERPLTREGVLSTDSASESTESVESSSGSPSPPTYTSQLQRAKAYNLYFDEDMPQTTADLIVMVALGKPSVKEVKMDQLQKMKKVFNLGLLRGKDKMTHIRAIANALRSEGYITIPESKEEDQGSLTRGDVKVVKDCFC